MIVYDSDDLDFVKSRDKTQPFTIDFEYVGPTLEERSWTAIHANGPKADMFAIGRWLRSVNITEWWWSDRAPDRMVHRNSLYFKNERDATMFSLWWSDELSRKS